jgi:threonylcarbamoyladenosine tRNA methylthiotransferase MtaB
VRGQSKSHSREEIVNRVEDYVAQGFREIVLTGVNLCLYGRDLEPAPTLLELLEELEAIQGLKQIRLSSLDPRLVTDDLLRHLISSPRICPHFHLSLQSGSDRLLRSMGREIETESFKRILDTLHEGLPMAALGADILVGFPGESDADFERTHSFLTSSPLTYLHVFAYSSRPGTPAAKMVQVKDSVRSERASLLRNLSRDKNMRFRRLFLGTECQGIVIKKGSSGTHILTSNYIDVDVPFSPAEEREVVMVRISEVSPNRTSGQIV